ncbi:MAG TPA: FN3 domain-containing metallophosphoesterase family protein [Tepidisphaeraceae bacterium]|jgi:hypothetical protein|nr:FN3 domain-containing metallophosphoesterase family protein [Tepidisphaeraceae bacterium]
MNRRKFVQMAGLSAVSAGMLGAQSAPAPKKEERAFGPVLMNVTSDEVTVVWGIGVSATGWVEFGETESLGKRADGEVGGLMPYGERVLRVRVGGLEAGKKYFYRVHSKPVEFVNAYKIRCGEETAGEVGSFTTLNASGATARFAVWNDTHEHVETIRKLVGMTGEQDFLFWNGDVVNTIDTEGEIARKFFDPAEGETYAGKVPVLFSRGNHDVRGAGARQLSRYVNGLGGRFYYWFRQGPVAFVVMDTGEDKPDDSAAYAGLAGFNAYREEQRVWLEKVIEEPGFKSAPFRVVFAHIPMVWDGDVLVTMLATYGKTRGWVSDDGLAKWGPLFDQAKVDVVISGHTHHHAWYPAKSGRSWGQIIGGGPIMAAATVINGLADGEKLELVMRMAANGEVVTRQEFRRQV